MQLKTRIVTTFNVDYGDLEAFIRHHTGRDDYEIVPSEEWSNDSQHTAKVEPDLDAFRARDFAAFKAGEHDGRYIWRTILDGLCKEGHLPAGEYVIEVCW